MTPRGGAGTRRSTRRSLGFIAVVLSLAGPMGPRPAASQSDAGGAGSAPETLLDRGRLQEAAWAFRAAGDTVRAEEILNRLRAILSAPPEDAEPLGMDHQGVSFTWRLRHGQGVFSIFKVEGSDVFCPECGVEREVAAYHLDRLLGFDLTPMVVMTRVVRSPGDTLRGSTMYFVAGARTPEEAGAVKPDILRFFDAVLGNSDRHEENWLIAGGRAVAIDHNRAFEWQPSTRPETCWETEVDSLAAPGDLGRPWERYRTVPADTVRSVLRGLEPGLARQFLTMREAVIARVEARALRPDEPLPLTDCAP